MARFTQLGLSANQDKKPEGKTPPNAFPEGRSHPNTKTRTQQKLAALIGSLIATALLGVFVFESGCSRESDKTATIATPNQSTPNQTGTAVSSVPAATTTSGAPSQPTTKKKSRQRKLLASTYTNPAYGISFRYPKYDSLKEAGKTDLDVEDQGLFAMNFVQAGGSAISRIELPSKFYAGTDFNSAFFNVSVNPKMTAAECEQFAFPEMEHPEMDSTVASNTRVGATEFRAVEGFAAGENNQADVKFYHVFQNSNCYEFALGLETFAANPRENNSADKPTLKPVDRNEVFRQLNWILSTVKIQPTTATEKTVRQTASEASPDRTNAAITEAH